jgi:hypothetical protein
VSDAILIAGYYRSGTSALSGMLQRLGVTLHNDAEVNEHNPLGFYEIPELIEWDVGVFSHLGVDWTDIRGLPDGWWERADLGRHFTKLDEILRRRFGAESLWAVKHPHLCRLFPMYERAVTQAGHKPHVIHICRAPWVVASSQHRKNGLARAHALLLWVDYLISVERHARHLPRSWLTYQDLMADPVGQLRRIEQDLGLELCNRVPNGLSDAQAFLSDQLNRSEPTSQETLFKPLQDLTVRVWDAVQARDFAPATWEAFAADCADLVGFLGELGTSRGVIVPGLGNNGAQKASEAAAAIEAGLRPAERTDDAAKTRLLRLRDAAPALPTVKVLVAVPPARAHAVNDTLESVRAQWQAPAQVKIISAESLDIPGYATVVAPAAPGELTRILCEEANAAVGQADYVAILSAGDTLAVDAVLRFALEAAHVQADMIYCDETVQADKGPWVRFKPNWDVTRLRQAAYVGDWVWYRADTLSRLGGFDAAQAGAEEYDYQLRLAEANGRVVRLPETLFSRAPLSRRDNIPSTEFGPRAVEMVRRHLERSGVPAAVEPRQHLGLFRHQRVMADPGTAVVLLCDGAEITAVDRWMNELLSGGALTGPIVLAGAALPAATARYITAVHEQEATLGAQVRAVPPQPGLTTSRALQAALALVTSEHVAIVDARAQAMAPHWLAPLRIRLADPSVALVGARSLVLAADKKHFIQQGPIITGAEVRLGAGHDSDDPGPGGWLAVDQEASAVAPGIVLARRSALAGWSMPALGGDALWIDLCAQLRQAAHKIVWTPDVSFIVPPESINPDPACAYRQGSPAAAALPWSDFYHHPALSLREDLLRPEVRLGLQRGAPTDPQSLLLSGPVDTGMALLNAARALRTEGVMEASWVPEVSLAAEIGRRAPTAWVRLNPEDVAPGGMNYTALFTVAPKPEQSAVLAAAQHLIATSPALVQKIRALLPPDRDVKLWRPALSRPIWQDMQRGAGLNTMPRVLWIDEGIAPAWVSELMNETAAKVTWIVVERAEKQYGGAITRLRPPGDETSWARELCGLAPHVLFRPVEAKVEADCYTTLLAAAAGCHLMVDQRLDVPESLDAARIPNSFAAWRQALLHAATDGLATTLERGKASRTAALALPSIEELPPPWLDVSSETRVEQAAE